MPGNGPALTIRIRHARPGDALALARLRYQFRSACADPGKRETQAAFVRRCAAWMRRALSDRRRWRCWVAVSRTPGAAATSAVVGHVWLQVIDKVPNPGAEAERHAYITNLYVQPAARGGTGQRLLAAAMGWCQARVIDSVILWPTADSRSLYARNGFGVSGDVFDARLTASPLADSHLKESLRMRASRRPARTARSSARRRAVAR